MYIFLFKAKEKYHKITIYYFIIIKYQCHQTSLTPYKLYEHDKNDHAVSQLKSFILIYKSTKNIAVDQSATKHQNRSIYTCMSIC